MAKDIEFAMSATEVDAQNKPAKNARVREALKLWEMKNGKRAAKGTGLALMLLSVAACGGGSDGASEDRPTQYTFSSLLAALRDGTFNADQSFELPESNVDLGELNVADLLLLVTTVADAKNFNDLMAAGIEVSYSVVDTAANVLAALADQDNADLIEDAVGVEISDAAVTLNVADLIALQNVNAEFAGSVTIRDVVGVILNSTADFSDAVVQVTNAKIVAQQYDALSQIEGFELGDVVVTYTLEQALAAHENGALAANYEIDPAVAHPHVEVSVADALSTYAAVAELIDGAENSADITLADVFQWSVVDTSAIVLANKTAAAIVGASNVTLNVETTEIADHNAKPGDLPFVVELAVSGEVVVNLQTNTFTSDGGFVIEVSDSNVTVNLGTSNDVVRIVSEGFVTVDGGSADDTSNDNITIVSSGGSLVNLGAGNDSVVAGDGEDSINVGAGNDSVVAGDGDDSIFFAAGDFNASDVVDGGEGIDTVTIGGEGNVIDAGNLVNVENLVLAGTVVTVSAEQLAAYIEAGLQSISGNPETSEVIVTGTELARKIHEKAAEVA